MSNKLQLWDSVINTILSAGTCRGLCEAVFDEGWLWISSNLHSEAYYLELTRASCDRHTSAHQCSILSLFPEHMEGCIPQLPCTYEAMWFVLQGWKWNMSLLGGGGERTICHFPVLLLPGELTKGCAGQRSFQQPGVWGHSTENGCLEEVPVPVAEIA